MVFLGTVTEALETRGETVSLARMRIDRAYKGVSEKTLILWDSGMCDGPDLKVGEQYVMYTQRWGDGPVPSRGCSRSANVKDAAEDLRFLNGLRAAGPTGSVFGRVSIKSDGIGDKNRPAEAAVVQIRGAGRTLETTVDGEGRYSFDGLKPAEYDLSASQPGYSMLSVSSRRYNNRASVEARGCQVVNIVMRRDWPGAIQGRLTRFDGAPAAAGIDLWLIRVERTGQNEKSDVVLHELAQTDDKGEYTFHQVAPGRYKVVMNQLFAPTPEVPYPTIYWPAASTEEAASEVEISDAAVSQRCDFRLPPELKSTLVTGTVLLPDGKPADRARIDIMYVVQPLGSHIGIRTPDPITDSAGHFSFAAMEGSEYSLTATKPGDLWLISDALLFSSSQGPQSITLTLVNRRAR
jgi:hypothetical protein